MTNIKTAVSLDENLFKQVEVAAHEMKVSRSRLFALALEEFLRRRETQQLVASLNEVYSGEPDPEDELALRALRHLYRKVLDAEGNE